MSWKGRKMSYTLMTGLECEKRDTWSMRSTNEVCRAFVIEWNNLKFEAIMLPTSCSCDNNNRDNVENLMIVALQNEITTSQQCYHSCYQMEGLVVDCIEVFDIWLMYCTTWITENMLISENTLNWKNIVE